MIRIPDTDYESFSRDETLKRAFVRSIEIIGEASKKLPEDIKAMQPEIEWRKVSGMRDKLIHDYFGADYLKKCHDIIHDFLRGWLYEISAKSLWGQNQRIAVFRQPLVFTDHKPFVTDHCRVQKRLFALGSVRHTGQHVPADHCPWTRGREGPYHQVRCRPGLLSANYGFQRERFLGGLRHIPGFVKLADPPAWPVAYPVAMNLRSLTPS